MNTPTVIVHMTAAEWRAEQERPAREARAIAYRAACDRYHGHSQSVEDCFRFGDVDADSPEGQEMERERVRLRNEVNRLRERP